MNNLDMNHRLVNAFESFIQDAADGMYASSIDEAVDTREPIENFFLGKIVTIHTERESDGIRMVYATIRHPDYKGVKEILIASDGEWSVVIVD